MVDTVYRKYPLDRYMPTHLAYEKVVTLAGCYLPSPISDLIRISNLLMFYYIFGN